MSSTANCQQCDSPLPSDAPGGICPQCLLGLGMQGPDPNRPTAAMPDGGMSEPFAAPSAEHLVNRFPNLEILHLIGQGGMGAVYQARQKSLDRLVALKILSPRLGNDPTFAERFMREARTLAKLSHPNIVTVFNFGQAEEMYFLVMEYVDGVNLRDTIQAKTLDPDKAMFVIPQICDALQYAHDKGVVHRDIKPENILVNTNGEVKIADFGLAKLLDPSAQDFTLTNTRQVMGTLKYMAPEQIEKPDDVDHRADLYSLGVVFYELLTGELPIGRFSLPSEKANVNDQLDDVVMKTLEKEPDRRYQQASLIKSAVTNAQQSDPSMTPSVASEERSFTASKPRKLAVPFRCDTTWHYIYGFASVKDGNSLELEIDVRNGVTGEPTSGVQKIIIPASKLVRVDFQHGWGSHAIEVQADSIDAFQDASFAKHGSAILKIKKVDGDRALRLVTQLQSLIGDGDPVYNAPVAPIKSGNDYAASEESSGQTRAPALTNILLAVFLFLGLGICAICASGVVFYSLATNQRVESAKAATDPTPAVPFVPTESVEASPANAQISPVEISPAHEVVGDAQPSELEFRRDLSLGVIIVIAFVALAVAIVVGLIILLVIVGRKKAANEV